MYIICLPVGRVVSVSVFVGFFVLNVYYMSSRRHQKGRIGVSFCILGINKQELFCNKQIGFMKIFFLF